MICGLKPIPLVVVPVEELDWNDQKWRTLNDFGWSH